MAVCTFSGNCEPALCCLIFLQCGSWRRLRVDRVAAFLASSHLLFACFGCFADGSYHEALVLVL